MIRYPGRLFFTLLLLLVSSFGNFAQFEKPQEVEEKNIYQIVDEEPQFPVGMEEMHNSFKGIWYTRKPRSRTTWRVNVMLSSLWTKRYVKKPVVERGVHGCPECDAEALRVVNLIPRWKPGKVGKKKVNCYFRLPINYRLE